MINDNDKAVAAVAAPAASQRGSYKKRELIFEKRFSFTDANLSRLKFKTGAKVDRRFDTKISGLCLRIYPTGIITFYAYKKVPQYNKNKNVWESNVVYKKMWKWAKNTGFNCSSAKDKVSSFLERIVDSRSLGKDEITFGKLAEKYMKFGLTGFKLHGNETREYKPGVIKQYTNIIRSYILLENCTHLNQKRLTDPIEFQGTIWTKPLKDYKASELHKLDIEAFKHRLKDTKQSCNTILKTISVIYSWARQNEIYKGPNPMEFVKLFPRNAVKLKLPDEKRDQILDYCDSKAFDYNPHFLTLVAMSLLTGCRSSEMFGLRWEEPLTEDEKKKCSGWLEPNWQDLEEKSHIVLWDTKNRREFRPYIRSMLKKLLTRLRKKLYEDPKHSWCLKSPYIFPKTRFKIQDPNSFIDNSSIKYHMWRLNEKFGLITEVNGKPRMFFTLKIGRKTFVTQVAKEKGVEIAARAVNHSDTIVTRAHYLVPDQEDIDFEFEEKKSNVENMERHRFDKIRKFK